MTRPPKSLHTLGDWIGGDFTDLAWSAVTVAVILVPAFIALAF